MPRAFLIKKHSPGKDAVSVKTKVLIDYEKDKNEPQSTTAFERVRPDYLNTGNSPFFIYI